MLVIAKNLVCAPPVEIGQRGAPLADFEKLGGEAALRMLAPDPLQPFFGSAPHSSRHRLARDCRELANRFFGRSVLDIKRHRGARQKSSSNKDKLT
ncbi:MAG TPA: hypothetical protein VEK82_13050 [Stellaceae bacterium]|nr:hypothetical protein [Stellaceae bacterium]